MDAKGVKQEQLIKETEILKRHLAVSPHTSCQVVNTITFCLTTTPPTDTLKQPARPLVRELKVL